MSCKKVAIYHYSHIQVAEPVLYKKQLKSLEDFAFSLGFEVTGIYCDFSMRRCEEPEFERFLSECTQYDALIVQDYHHINKNTSACLKLMKQLREAGLSIYSLKNGIFTFEDEPLSQSLRVATYYCREGTPSELRQIVPVKNDILNLYAKMKTNWTVIDQYFDESPKITDKEKIQLTELIKAKDKYDLILVHSLSDIYWRTAHFCKVREELKKDIFSLQDGFLKYRMEDL